MLWQPTPVFLPVESPRTEEPGRLQSLGSPKVKHMHTQQNVENQHLLLFEMFL